MNNIKLTSKGFAHVVLLSAIVVIVGIGGSAIYIIGHRGSNKSNATLESTDSSSDNNIASPTSDTTKTATKQSTQTNANTTNSKPSASSNTVKNNASSSSKNQTTSATALSTLISIITKLKNGSADAKVTTSSVEVPGPISTAHARPNVFTLNGKTFFAYTQTYAPDFSQSASTLANQMSLISATVKNPALTSAHLDKSGNLVDASIVAVGFSTGGN